jgi:hypothetical protein
MTNAKFYEGLSQETIDRYKREAREQFDPQLVETSEKRARKMSKAAWPTLKAEGEVVNYALASMISHNPEDSDVQAMIARHHATIEPFYHTTAELYRGLGALYVENPEFLAYYEKYALGLPEFLHRAMAIYADRVLIPKEEAQAFIRSDATRESRVGLIGIGHCDDPRWLSSHRACIR